MLCVDGHRPTQNYIDNPTLRILDVLELRSSTAIGSHPDLDSSQYTTYEM